ncbi:MAG: hypothetical protein ABI836_04060 [Gemmatimonadota bacterium]
MKQRAGWILFALMTVTAPAVVAQLPPVGLPGGMFRFELGGQFGHADSRFQDGVTQDIARSFTTNAIGGQFYAPLRAGETAIGRIIGNVNYQLNAGRSVANGLIQVGTGFIGASYGLTSRISLFVTVPIVQTRSQIHLAYDSAGADAGINPSDPVFGTAQGQSQTNGFFTDFTAALNQLQSNISNGLYDANPAQKQAAQDALDQGTVLRGELTGIFANREAPFVPTGSSTAGNGIIDSITTYQSTLATLAVPGFASQPALALQPMDSTAFQGFLTNPGGPIAVFPLEDVAKSRMGDIEGGIGYTVVDRWNQGDHAGGLRVAVEARMRFPTGLIDRSDDLIDVGTGTGHLAAGVAGTMDLGTGKIGVRVRGGYERSFARNIDRRVSSPLQAITPFTRLRTVKEQPGDLIDIAVTPFFRLVPTIALIGGVRLRRHGADQVSYTNAADSIPGVSASVLAEGSDWNLTTYLAGLSYQSPAAITQGKSGFPIEANWTVEGPLSSSAGLVAKGRLMRFQIRLYTKLFN